MCSVLLYWGRTGAGLGTVRLRRLFTRDPDFGRGLALTSGDWRPGEKRRAALRAALPFALSAALCPRRDSRRSGKSQETLRIDVDRHLDPAARLGGRGQKRPKEALQIRRARGPRRQAEAVALA